MEAFLLMFGPHGSGKGTHAEFVSRHYGIPKISTGDIFRDMLKAPGNAKYIPPELVKAVEAHLNRKEYVPDDITNQVVRHRLSEKDCKRGFILDGYPRTVSQMEFLDGLLEGMGHRIDAVINLAVSEDELVKRQLYRMTCEKCGASYNTLLNPPKKEGVCDRCGSRLYKRSDDNEEAIRKRNREYEKKALPLLGFYRKRGLVIDVVGTGRKPDEVFKEIKANLDKRLKK